MNRTVLVNGTDPSGSYQP